MRIGLTNFSITSIISLAGSSPASETALKKESEISSDFTATDDPSDIGGSIVGLGNKRRLTPREKEMQSLRDRIDAEPDEDIKNELRKGNTVEIIEDN